MFSCIVDAGESQSLHDAVCAQVPGRRKVLRSPWTGNAYLLPHTYDRHHPLLR